MFTVEERDRVRELVLALGREDERIVAAAEVGSLAAGPGDEWSDLDLTFAVGDGTVEEVLADWTKRLERELEAVHLFDLPSGPTIYRVLLLPNLLQVDLSFTPADEFGAGGPKWRLLFGTEVERPPPAPPSADELLGYAVLHARAARVSIERGRPWHAEYWIGAIRDHALSLACLRRGLPARYGRGFDDLPPELLAAFEPAIVRSLARDELERALRCAVEGLLLVAEELAARVEPQLRELAAL